MKGIWTFDVTYDALRELGLEATVDNLLEALRNETGHEGYWFLVHEKNPAGYPCVAFYGERDVVRRWIRDVHAVDENLSEDEVESELAVHFMADLF